MPMKSDAAASPLERLTPAVREAMVDFVMNHHGVAAQDRLKMKSLLVQNNLVRPRQLGPDLLLRARGELARAVLFSGASWPENSKVVQPEERFTADLSMVLNEASEESIPWHDQFSSYDHSDGRRVGIENKLTFEIYPGRQRPKHEMLNLIFLFAISQRWLMHSAGSMQEGKNIAAWPVLTPADRRRLLWRFWLDAKTDDLTVPSVMPLRRAVLSALAGLPAGTWVKPGAFKSRFSM